MIKRLKSIACMAAMVAVAVSGLAQKTYELNTDWKCKKAADVNGSGNDISRPGYSVKGWMPATVPGTVLTTLLDNKKIPDPFYGMNNKYIPDIYRTGKAYYTYWFVEDFKEMPAAAGRQVWLNFRGINYGCDIFLNGHRLNAETSKGMFLRQRYNITAFLAPDGHNRLAVIVYPPDAVGNPNGGQGGDGTIAKNVSHQYVAGWDWIQPVHDRNTGIWDKVILEETGPVAIRNPHVITDVPGIRLPDDSNQAPAVVHLSAELENAASVPVSGLVRYMIGGEKVQQKVTVPAHTTEQVQLPDITLKHPRLWWPNTVGAPNLYRLCLEFISDNQSVSDADTLEVGVREIHGEWNGHTQSMEVKVNGQPVFIKGGDWIISDEMLRLSKQRYDAEIRFHRDMNLNLLRVWGGALTERPEFYEACDKYGLMVMQDFWGSGDCDGRWIDPQKKDDQWMRRLYPDDHALFIQSAADQIRMLRNYPSLAVWCGGNEITQPEDLQHALADSLMPLLDTTRRFIDYSNSDSMSYNPHGDNGDGPYGIQDVAVFWKHRTYPFNSEVGSVGVGDATSLKRFLPKENQVVPVEGKGRENVSDSVWTYHKYIGYGNALLPYGKPKDMADFADKAQLVNYDQYRSLIEGFSAHEWDWYTGVIIWKTQNPWTALRGQMYDYYLDPNAGLYGLRAAGKPLHLMFNPADSSVYILNNGYQTRRNMMMVIKAYDMRGKSTLLTQVVTQAVPQRPKPLLFIGKDIARLASANGMFLALQLLDMDKKVISENIYWLTDSTGKYSGLGQMPASKLGVRASLKTDSSVEVTLSNPDGAPVAFFNRISVIDKTTKQRLLPCFYSDNYVTVLPGATKTVTVECPAGFIAGKAQVEISGWNLSDRTVEIEAKN